MFTSDLELPLLTQTSSPSIGNPNPPVTSASSLLAASKAASSSANYYRTLSPPIDRLVGPSLQRGYGLQISGPPGTYVEQLVLGLTKSVTGAGKEVVLVDMQNKIKADNIVHVLNNDALADRVHYGVLHKLPDVVDFLTSLPKFLSKHPNVSLLVLSSLSFPYQAENNYSTRNSLLGRVRELIIKLCKQNELVAVITTTMSTHFVNPDGSRGTFGGDAKGIMNPQMDLHCKSISTLTLSRHSRRSGRAIFAPAAKQTVLRADLDFLDLEFNTSAISPAN